MKRDINDMTPDDIRKAGIEALVKYLGPVGMAKFIGQFDLGTGDYTKGRSKWLSEATVSEVVSQIKMARKRKGA